jgi:hypothetical protein
VILNKAGKIDSQQTFNRRKTISLFFSEVRKMKNLKFLILAAALASQPAWANDYQWTKVVAGEEITGLRATGMIIPQAGALKNQSALTQGRILSVLKREGDTVQPGDPLFLVNDAECISLTEEMRLAQKNKVQELIDAASRGKRNWAWWWKTTNTRSCRFTRASSPISMSIRGPVTIRATSWPIFWIWAS